MAASIQDAQAGRLGSVVLVLAEAVVGRNLRGEIECCPPSELESGEEGAVRRWVLRPAAECSRAFCNSRPGPHAVRRLRGGLYNPLDSEGFQQIQVGDRVSVGGTIDYDFLEGRELVASSIVTLSKDDS